MQAAAAFRASVEDHQRRAITRAVEALEDAPITTQLLEQAQRVKGTLDASHQWTEASPVGVALVIRLAGGYDDKQSLYSRVARVRSLAMSTLGRSATGNPVSKQAPASLADRAVDFVLYGDTDARTASGLASAAADGAAEGAAEVIDRARGAAPWVALGVGALVVLVLVVKVLR